MKNYPLLRKTWEHIEAHPEEHDQDHWGRTTPCGTTMCFAGQAVVLGGLKPIWETVDGAEEMTGAEFENGIQLHVWDAAEKILGLSPGESDRLFMDCNNLEDVRQVIGEYLDEEGAGDVDGVE